MNTPDRKTEPYPAEKARGGDIILRKRWQRLVFIAGLAGAALLGFSSLFGGVQNTSNTSPSPLPPAFRAMA